MKRDAFDMDRAVAWHTPVSADHFEEVVTDPSGGIQL